MKTVVIIGAGFGGIHAAKYLENYAGKFDFRIILISERNYFTFVPLLHEVSAGFLKQEKASCSLKNIFKTNEVGLIQDKVVQIDTTQKKVMCNRQKVSYDYLLIATGASTNFYGVEGAEKNSLEIKNREDAEVIHTEIQSIAATKKTITIIGGGATGVELSGEIACFLRKKRSQAKIQLIQAVDRLLPVLDPKLSEKAKQQLEKIGVATLLNTQVTKVSQTAIVTKDRGTLKTDMTIWAAGIKGNTPKIHPEIEQKNGCLIVDEFLRVKNYQNAFAIGDSAMAIDPKTQKPFPFLAQTAISQSRTASLNILAEISQKDKKTFQFKSLGVLISVGRYYAVGTPLGMNMSGWLPWMMKKVSYRTLMAMIRKGMVWHP